jgi:hypothetical protein
VLPINVLLPVCVVEPDTLRDPVTVNPFVNLPEPDTSSEPVNIAGPMLVNVLDPLTVNDPVTCKLLGVAHVSLPTKENGCEDPVGP